MSSVKVATVFAVTTPSVSVTLAENRIGEVPFTVTNVSTRKLRARVRIVPAGGAPADWFSVEGDSEQDFEIGAARQFVVRVDPPLGAPAGTYPFRLDAIGIEHPDDDYSEGPSCQVTIQESTARPRLTTPRGYLTTLVGAFTGGIVLDLVVVVLALTHNPDTDCHGLGFWACLFKVLFKEIAFWVGLVFLGFLLMLVGASLGAAIALRIRRFRGHKLTATFLAFLMLPWALLMIPIFRLLDNFFVVAAVSPILLLAVPAVLARGSVLLIRTHHI